MSFLKKINSLFGDGFLSHLSRNGLPEGYRHRKLSELKSLSLREIYSMSLFDLAYVKIEE